ncbi:putative cell division protease, partial [Listeria ivanovii FSL F6-596]
MNRFFRNAIFYVIIFLVIIGIVASFNSNKEAAKDISYTEFMSKLEDGKVKSLTIQPDRSVYTIEGEFKSSDKSSSDDKKTGLGQSKTSSTAFTTYALNSDTSLEELQTAVSKEDVKMEVEPAKQNSGWVTFLTSIVPFVIIFILFFFLMSQSQGGGGGKVMSFGKSKAKLYNDDKKKVRFTDVAGADEEKQELVE